MIRELILTVDENVSYKDVEATRGKLVRAQPIEALYEGERPRIHHVGNFPKMEEEMCSYVPEITKQSPNRMDALVWALTELFPGRLRLLDTGQLDTLQALSEGRPAPVQKIVQSTLTKPAMNDKTEACPHCGHKPLAHRGHSVGCPQCGKWWSDMVVVAKGGRGELE